MLPHATETQLWYVYDIWHIRSLIYLISFYIIVLLQHPLDIPIGFVDSGKASI